MRPALCEDALRLGRILAELEPDQAEVHGLVALMEINASRTTARTDASGEPVLLLEGTDARIEGTPPAAEPPAAASPAADLPDAASPAAGSFSADPPDAGSPAAESPAAAKTPAERPAAKTTRERAEEKRQAKLDFVREQVDNGSLVIRGMTDEERLRYPPPPTPPPRRGWR